MMANSGRSDSRSSLEDGHVGQKAVLAAAPSDDDPVISALHTAEDVYRLERRDAADLAAKVAETSGALSQARQELNSTRSELRSLSERLTTTEQALKRDRERTVQLAEALRDLHRAVFSGNIYELLLRACLKLTGAARGLYITVRDQDRNLRIRAAVDIDGYPGAAPSEYLKALCFRVIKEHDPLVCNADEDRADLPKPATDAERFDNVIVVPVVLLKGLDGIVIAADRTAGDFTREHVEALVAIGEQATVAMENHQLRQDLQRAYLTTITALADAVEAKDAYTGGHCERVARYAHRLGEELGLPERSLGVVYCGGLLHDVGKIGVSDGVLNKPGTLLPEERALVHSHVRVGHDIVSKVPMLNEVADAVLYHHEWYDGSGYPEGLSGEAIPLTARIVSVADSYSAMIDRRVYKEPMPTDRARDELERCAGTQFDPEIVTAFLRVLDRGDLHREEEDEIGFAPLLGLTPAKLS
jgi:putative nucleotidyltransferase with HDIG domain